MMYRLYESKSLWLEQINHTQSAFRLPARPSLAAKSLQELRSIATRPYAFENGVAPHRLSRLVIKPRMLNPAFPFMADPLLKVETAELAPGGRWLVMASSSNQPRNGFWMTVWDLEKTTADGQSASPVAAYNVKTSSTSPKIPRGSICALVNHTSIQPAASAQEEGFLVFTFSTVEIPQVLLMG